MHDERDHTALVRHAVQAGDWRLVELIAHALTAEGAGSLAAAQRAYCTLAMGLGLLEPYPRA